MGTSLALYAFPYAMLEESPHRMVWRGMRLVAAFGVPIGFWISQGIRQWGSAPAFARSRACPREMPELLRVHPPPEDALELRLTDPLLFN